MTLTKNVLTYTLKITAIKARTWKVIVIPRMNGKLLSALYAACASGLKVGVLFAVLDIATELGTRRGLRLVQSLMC